jgi:HD-GYP domain-containing protein (c-di-GMP phosphodiesterase class II)
MALERIKTNVRELKIGMFVSELDCPWHKTPFPIQGFIVRSKEEMRSLQKFCEHVFVDANQSEERDSSVEHAVSSVASRADQSGSASSARKRSNAAVDVSKVVEVTPLVVKDPKQYQVAASLPKEAARVQKLYGRINDSVREVCAAVDRGEEINVEDIQGIAVSMVVSVARNPDALVWLSKMDQDDEFGYQHVVRASIWALVFARHLGLSKSLMKTLAIGVLLSHVGKTKLEPALRDPQALSDDQMQDYQRYVELGLAELSNTADLGDGVLSVVEFHAERNNGSGFPKGVTGERIPLLAKIAGLVDCYQDMITPRGDRLGLSPKDAVSLLYEQRNILFQKDLVERFIEAIGVFPTGTLIELNSNEVGIVTGHNSERRLLPKIIVVTDANKNKLKAGRRVDLLEWNASQKPQHALYIKDSLPKGALGIDENSYLLTGATSKWSLKHMVSSLTN